MGEIITEGGFASVHLNDITNNYQALVMVSLGLLLDTFIRTYKSF